MGNEAASELLNNLTSNLNRRVSELENGGIIANNVIANVMQRILLEGGHEDDEDLKNANSSDQLLHEKINDHDAKVKGRVTDAFGDPMGGGLGDKTNKDEDASSDSREERPEGDTGWNGTEEVEGLFTNTNRPLKRGQT